MRNKYEEMTDEELNQEYDFIVAERRKRGRVKREEETKKLNINGITAKDIAVRCGLSDYGSSEMNYAFYVKRDGKLYDIYYDCGTYDKNNGHRFAFHPWWPILPMEENQEEPDSYSNNGAFQFIPPGFVEACENMYEYRGTTTEAIAQLKKVGITDIEEGEW